MMSRHQPTDIHPLGCACEACEPYEPSTPRLAHAADVMGLCALAGIGVALVLIWIFDRVIGGPGLGPMFGL